MGHFIAKDEDYIAKVTNSFVKQEAMKTIGTSLLSIEPGVVKIELLPSRAITQQHGFVHGGIVATVLDSATGYAALSLMPADCAILSVEFKVNFLSPAKGDRFVAVGKVKKPGSTISVCDGELYAYTGTTEKLVATMNATLIQVVGRGIEN